MWHTVRAFMNALGGIFGGQANPNWNRIDGSGELVELGSAGERQPAVPTREVGRRVALSDAAAAVTVFNKIATPATTVEKDDKGPCNIKSADFKISVNTFRHHTDKYEITNEYFDPVSKSDKPAQLVVRRGQDFRIKLQTDRDFDTAQDKIVVNLDLGNEPLLSKGTHFALKTGEAEHNGWQAEVKYATASGVELVIHIPATCAVGKWQISFDTILVTKSGKEITKPQKIKQDVFILFNAWCEADPVYIENESLRDEYVLNDSGKIYTGNYKQIFGRPWNFAQFESVVLECILWLLDNKSRLPWTQRGDPIMVSRMISSLVNSCDNSGILSGRWDGEYTDGISPTKWTGSEAIIQQYLMDKKPVKYGQCWVFSGVTTSVCRALGLPARSITNFASAHDTDGSLTIDVHWDENAEHIPELNHDSVWNFHVWNEAWMARSDLVAGFGGWQAIDATPQESSGGVYCAGPSSVRAIKTGTVNTLFDTGFIFAEVNADKVHWIKQKDGSQPKNYIERDVIGRNISTKAPGASRGFSFRGFNPDREDVTLQYKYAEGSSQERAAVWKAARSSTKPSVYRNDASKEDVLFKVLDIDGIFVGSSFEVPIEIKNTSRTEKRNVDLTSTLSYVYYTGVHKDNIKHQSWQKELAPNSKINVVMSVSADDYLEKMTDFTYNMKINYLASVTETKQIFASMDDFRLRTLIPDLTSSSSRVRVGEKFTVKCKFVNPLKKTLTNCVFGFEAAGNLKHREVKISSVEPGAEAECECPMTAKRAGDCVVICSFECDQMGNVQGQCSVTVEDKA